VNGIGWAAPSIDESKVAALATAMRIRPLTARLLVARGVAEADLAARFLAPRLADLRPPDGMADLPRALDRLAAALAAGETIGVFGDYDVDGVTTRGDLDRGAARFRSWWKQGGGARREPERRLRAGRRRRRALRRGRLPRARHGRLRTSDHAALTEARARGVDAIVIDHHELPEGETRRLRAGQLAPFRRRLPVQGAGLLRGGVLPGGRAAQAARVDRSTRASSWIWSRSERSPIWSRWSRRTGSWSPPACNGCPSASARGWRRWRYAPSSRAVASRRTTRHSG
jgi:hypothetical protein